MEQKKEQKLPGYEKSQPHWEREIQHVVLERE